MKLVTAIGLLAVTVLVGTVAVRGLEHVEKLGYERGVKASPQTPCYPFVKEAEDRADVMVKYAAELSYQTGVVQAVDAMKAYVLDACINKEEVQVDGQTFICLRKQEM